MLRVGALGSRFQCTNMSSKKTEGAIRHAYTGQGCFWVQTFLQLGSGIFGSRRFLGLETFCNCAVVFLEIAGFLGLDLLQFGQLICFGNGRFLGFVLLQFGQLLFLEIACFNQKT